MGIAPTAMTGRSQRLSTNLYCHCPHVYTTRRRPPDLLRRFLDPALGTSGLLEITPAKAHPLPRTP
eukprot:5220566-Pyramimonas_sp.AAC.1